MYKEAQLFSSTGALLCADWYFWISWAELDWAGLIPGILVFGTTIFLEIFFFVFFSFLSLKKPIGVSKTCFKGLQLIEFAIHSEVD